MNATIKNATAARGREILRTIDPDIRTIYERHIAGQSLWMPSELFSSEFEVPKLPPEITAMLILNLLTEDGLPYFLALLTEHLGAEHAIGEWSRMWTAEEDRHGRALQIYLDRVLTQAQVVAVEHMQYSYLKQGFWPDWGGDPIKLLAYVVLQEQATKVSHLGIARNSKDHDPILFGFMKKIAAEEAKHHKAYFGMFQSALAQDTTHGLQAILFAIRNFAMPGNGIASFSVLSEVQARCNVFGPQQFAEIVDEVIVKLGLANLSGLDIAGEKARDAIVATTPLLRRIAERKRDTKTFALPGFGDDFVFTL